MDRLCGRTDRLNAGGHTKAWPGFNNLTKPQKFIDHARQGDSVFTDLGATRVVECWGDDVPEGKVTDFRRAVQAEADETVAFSWVEWPDKATRDAALATMTDWMNHPETADPRMDPEKNPMPFDGKRMIFGGFTPVVEV